MERIEISESELLEALKEAADAEPDWGPEDAHTTSELARALGVDQSYVREMIRKRLRAGEVECVKVRRRAMDGRLSRVPAYRALNGDEEAAA